MAMRTGVALLVSILAVSFCGSVAAELEMNPKPGVLWAEEFDTVVLNPNRHDGWGLGDPPHCALTVKDGVATMTEIGERSYGPIQYYIPYDLDPEGEIYPYFKFRLLEAPGKVQIGDASTAGQGYFSRIEGPALAAIDIRQTRGFTEGKRRPKGTFALSLMLFGPRGHEPGEPVKFDWIRMTSDHSDVIDAELKDNQPEGKPGHGYASVGDELTLTVDTSEQVKGVTFELLDTKTDKPLKIDGKTAFAAATDQDRAGKTWRVTLPITAESDTTFKTWTVRKGQVRAGKTRVAPVAKVDGGSFKRLVGYLDFGFDLTPTTGGAPGAGPAAKPPEELLHGETLLESDFDKGEDRQWRVIAGNQWVFQRGRFGDLSDSPGPEGQGNWAVAGEGWWDDVTFTAEMAEELDGAGSVFLAVRFQDPKNFVGLEWIAARPDVLQLVRVKDGNKFVLAKSEGHELDDWPFTLGVSISGDLMTATLKGQPVATAYAADFESGPVAIGERGRKVLVDNVKVTRIVSKAKTSEFLRNCRLDYGRKARYFLRDTGELDLPLVIRNASEKDFDQVHLRVTFDAHTDPYRTPPRPFDSPFEPVEISIPTLKAGETKTVAFPIDTRMVKVGEYMLRARLSIPREGLVTDRIIHLGVARNWNPHRFNYFTWGLPRTEEDLKDYAEHGHTMGIGGGRATPLDWEYGGRPVPEEKRPKRYGPSKNDSRFHTYDLALKYGIVGGTNLLTTHGDFFPDELYAEMKAGRRKYLMPYHPTIREFSIELAKTYAKTYGDYPGYRLININTETENHLHPDFSDIGLARMRKLFGSEPPEGAVNMYAFPHTEREGLAKDGVIDDDNPYLRFYRWYWVEGEGYDELATDMANAVRKVDDDIMTFHDPAARMPYVRDRHEDINLWDWTYTTPNALTLPYKIEVLRAMAEKPNDKICNYVQVLWKRQTASDKNECPSASIIRLGLLYSSSRPVYAAGHWNTGWMRVKPNRDRWEAVKHLSDNFWKPLGPVLTRLTVDRPRKIAFLVSHTNELFTAKDRGTWKRFTAYAGWHEAFARAGLPVDIVFEEDVAEGKLANYEALFIPLGELIGRSAHEKIVAFAEGGGKVVADHNLGYTVPNATILENDLDHLVYPRWAWMLVKRKGNGTPNDERLKKMWATTAEIERVFADIRRQGPTPGDRWLIVNERRTEGGARYLYAVNDHRAPGPIGKKYGVMIESGRPLTATVAIPDAAGIGAVYDLTTHRRVDLPAGRQGNRLTIEADYPPASAKVFALAPKPIGTLEVTVPENPVRPGQPFTLSARLLDEDGGAVPGAMPLKLTVRDGQGSRSEYSDHFAFVDGDWSLKGHIAMNDTPGTWSVTVKDLASGKTVTRYFEVPVEGETARR